MKRLKDKIRKEILAKRIALAEKDVREKSLLIKKKLFNLKEFKRAELIMFYASFKNEVRTLEMIEEAISLGKKAALPVTSKQDGTIRPYLIFDIKKDLVPGYRGILEPKISNDVKEERKINPEEIDMIIAPGIAFDKKGYRIGFGKGCYDRFLHSISSRTSRGAGLSGPFCAGLAFEIQMVENLPREDYDERVDVVITERQIYETK
jgi:5-formyltetrahydrofolate cyclo-ligase